MACILFLNDDIYKILECGVRYSLQIRLGVFKESTAFKISHANSLAC